jgi:hypothetical protein
MEVLKLAAAHEELRDVEKLNCGYAGNILKIPRILGHYFFYVVFEHASRNQGIPEVSLVNSYKLLLLPFM